MKLLKSDPNLFYSSIIGKKVICFGAGKMAVDAIKVLGIRDNVDFFYDNAKNKWNTFVGADGAKYQVHNPAEIKELTEIKGMVFLITNRDYYTDILHQLDGFENIQYVDAFIYSQFELDQIAAFQKTEKYLLMQKYWKSVKLKQKEKQLEVGLHLLNYLFDINMFWAKEIARLSLQNQKKLSALRIFTKLYNAGYEQEEIFKLVVENYSVHSKETDNLFVKNREFLNEYPYFWGRKTLDPEKEWIYFQEENTIFPYERTSRVFGHEIILQEPHNAFCHLEDNDAPVFLKDIYNEWILIYLFYIVRASEDYGGDNHIYLYYESADEFYNFLHFIDLSFLGEGQKFVIMLEEENKSKYPLLQSFCEKEQEPTLLKVNEMQVMCILASNGLCGSGFFTGVMTSNKYVVGNEDKSFYYYTEPLILEKFKEIIQDLERKYTYQEILTVLEKNINKIEMPRGDKALVEYVEFFKKNYKKSDIFNVADIWKIYFIAKYYLDGGSKKTRFVPRMFWDIHVGSRREYEKILSEFKVIDYLAPIRNPNVRLARFYDRRSFGAVFENHYDDLKVKLLNGFDQRFGHRNAFRHKYVAVKFEDCKMYPQEMFRKICYTLCIPYQEAMLSAEAIDDGLFVGQYIKGFDLSPVNREIGHVFSTLDEVKLELFYSQINEHYGYKYYDFEEQPITDEEVESLFSIPFRMEADLYDKAYTRVKEDREFHDFDYKNTDPNGENIYFSSKEDLHGVLKDMLMKGYKISRYEKIRFPYFIRKGIQGSDFEEFS